jgi:hypothetical protein
MRSIGFGFFKRKKPVGVWCRDSVEWIDRWTHYRARAEIERAFAQHFVRSSPLESEWLEHKFSHAAWIRHLPGWSKRAIVRLLAGLVFACEKPVKARSEQA